MPPHNYHDVDYSSVPLDFTVPFAGLFMADGYVGLMRNRCKTGKWTYALRTSVSLREDDSTVLELAHRYFGGSIGSNSHKDSFTQTYWNLSGMPRVKAFLELILPFARPLCARKINDCDLALEFCAWRLSVPHKLTDEDRATQEDFYQRMKAIKTFSGA